MKLFKRFVGAAFIFILYFSCKKEQVILPSPSFNYFPVEKGKFVVYDVDSVFHADNDNSTDDSIYMFHFQLKEVIGETFSDGEGRPVQVIKQFRRDNDTLDWLQIGVCSQVLTSSGAYRTEENITYHKLAFPFNDQITWDGNDANTLGDEFYTYQDIHLPKTFAPISFDSTITVLQIDESNFIEKTYGVEIYANHIGVVYKERDELKKVNDMVVGGTELRMKVKSYGTE